ncbi:MAG: hypothetical protein JST28_09250 [Acidobacteria bacterium]|nr:hypothetical protein [Acidobacteriota bacterium]
MSRKPPDWQKTGTVAGYAEYLRKQAGAFVVVVIRRDDAVIAIDEDLAPKDAGEQLADRLPRLLANVDQARKEGRAAARDVMEPVRE